MERIHFHVLARTMRLGEAYFAAEGDAPPYRGARLMDWLWRNHESLGHTDEKIRRFVARAREIRRW